MRHVKLLQLCIISVGIILLVSVLIASNIFSVFCHSAPSAVTKLQPEMPDVRMRAAAVSAETITKLTPTAAVTTVTMPPVTRTTTILTTTLAAGQCAPHTQSRTANTQEIDLWQTMDSNSYNSPQILDAVSSWDALNPSIRHKVLNDSAIDVFMASNFGTQTYEVFRGYPLNVMRADMWRIAVIYARGGVYADADSRCIKPIKEWWNPDECDAVVGIEYSQQACNWVFASKLGHPLFHTALTLMVDKVLKYREKWGADVSLVDHTDEHFVHHFTGPTLLTKAIEAEYGQVRPGNFKSRTGRSDKNLCIRDHTFFSSLNTQNLFGSKFLNGSMSWTKQRVEILRPRCVERGGNGSTFGFSDVCPGWFYCCGLCDSSRNPQPCKGFDSTCACTKHELD
eukprot:m.68213 g.68213  ORF g.68213 m.68213 type:complete len:396 (+) comp8498_c0_seq1:268-1455(+)